ncbi:hypothetical protein SPHINGO8AM_40171 [Sphingomonas sp. 8AM]|nr:hypothetical protein SPHINGO8AM_40171 [Sphingomonas sp. 8AM]
MRTNSLLSQGYRESRIRRFFEVHRLTANRLPLKGYRLRVAICWIISLIACRWLDRHAATSSSRKPQRYKPENYRNYSGISTVTEIWLLDLSLRTGSTTCASY